MNDVVSIAITGASVAVAAGSFVYARKLAQERAQLLASEKKTHDELQRVLNAERVAHAAAEQANRIKDEFLGVVSHELRTPLNAIVGWSGLLMEGAENEKELKEGLEAIERNAQMQARLVDDLLDVSRIITGKLKLEIADVDLRDIVGTVVDSLTPAAAARGVSVMIGESVEPAKVRGDAARLQQIVWNLVSNSVKFTTRGGQVVISLFHTENEIGMEVCDTGQGIMPEFLPRLFERFTQQDMSTTRGQAGLGMGLAITRHLVELHGGKIFAQSEGRNKGATIRVQIPEVTTIEPATTPGSAFSPVMRANYLDAHRSVDSLEGVSILIVDDMVDTLNILSRMLSRAGAKVRGATSAEQAMEILSEWQPRVLLSDIGMPDRDGYSLIREIRQSPVTAIRELPAIAVTAFSRESDRVAALESGFNDYLAKPVDAAQLIEKIGQLAVPAEIS